MAIESAASAKNSGLSTLADVVISPADAFERLRTAPTWGWALLCALILLLGGTYLQGPATRHAGVAQIQRMTQTSSLFANLSEKQKQDVIARAGQQSPFAYAGPIFALFLAVFFNAIILLVGNAVGRGQADFKRLWCGSMNIAVPTLGIGAVVLGIITTLRGADSFTSSLDIARALPSLGSLAPGASPAVFAFLSGISIFTLWGFFLNATMLRVTAKTSSAVAYTFAALVLFVGALVAAGSVALAHNFGAV